MVLLRQECVLRERGRGARNDFTHSDPESWRQGRLRERQVPNHPRREHLPGGGRRGCEKGSRTGAMTRTKRPHEPDREKIQDPDREKFAECDEGSEGRHLKTAILRRDFGPSAPRRDVMTTTGVHIESRNGNRTANGEPSMCARALGASSRVSRPAGLEGRARHSR